MNIEDNKKIFLLEGVILGVGRNINLKKIGDIFDVSSHEVMMMLSKLNEFYEKEGRELRVVFDHLKCEIVGTIAVTELLNKVFKKEFSEEISPTLMEVLSLVAYLQPVQRIKLESIRGVNCGKSLKELMEMGLLDVVKNDLHNVVMYSLSLDAYKLLGITKKEELPQFEKYSNFYE